MGKIAHDHLGFPARLKVAAAIGIANHRSRVGDIYPLRIRSGRIKRYSERLIEARGKHVIAAALCRSVGSAQNPNPPSPWFRNEDDAVPPDPDHARIPYLG